MLIYKQHNPGNNPSTQAHYPPFVYLQMNWYESSQALVYQAPSVTSMETHLVRFSVGSSRAQLVYTVGHPSDQTKVPMFCAKRRDW